jgi:hypothetical protein
MEKETVRKTSIAWDQFEEYMERWERHDTGWIFLAGTLPGSSQCKWR